MLKRALFFLLLGLFTTVSTIMAQDAQFAIPFEVSDGANMDTLYFGVHPDGTVANDASLDTTAPPPPPSGAFDIVLENPNGERFFTDIRDNSIDQKVYTVTYAAASGEGPVYFRWDSTQFGAQGEFLLQKVVSITGDTLFTIDMSQQDSLNMAQTSLDNSSGSFKILVTPNLAPTIDNPLSDTTVNANSSAFSMDLTNVFSDTEGDELSFSASSSNSTSASATVDGDSLTVTPKAEGTVNISVVATDEPGKTAEDVFEVHVNPVFEVNSQLQDTTMIVGDASGPIDLMNTYFTGGTSPHMFSAGSDASGVVSASTSNDTLNFTAQSEGSATITVDGTDHLGFQLSQSFTVTARPPLAKDGSIGNVRMNVGGQLDSITAGNYFTGGIRPLSFSVSSGDAAVVSAAMSDDNVSLTAEGTGTATVELTATGKSGASVTQSFDVTVNPELTVAASMNDTTIINGNTVSSGVNISDNFTGGTSPLSFSASSSDDGIVQASVSSGDLSFEGTGTGQATVTVTATDDIGATASFEFVVTVNAQLQADNTFDDMELDIGTESSSLQLSSYFMGGIGSYTYSWTSGDSNVATASITDGDLTVTAHDNGSATLNVMVEDERGNSFTQSFNVTVVIPTVDVSYPNMLSGAVNSSQTIAITVGDLPNMDITSFDFGFHYDSDLLAIEDSDVQLDSDISGSLNASVTGDDSVLVSYSGSSMIQANDTLFSIEVSFSSEGQNQNGFEISRGELQSPDVPLSPDFPVELAVYSGELKAVGSVSAYSLTDDANAFDIDPDTLFAGGIPPYNFSSSLSESEPLDVSRDNGHFVFSPAAVGTTQVTITATDDQGATADLQFMVYIESGNTPPPATSIDFPNDGALKVISGSPDETIDIVWDQVSDAEGQQVTYTYRLSSNNSFNANGTFFEMTLQDTGRFQISYSTMDSLLADQGMSVGDTLSFYHRINTSDQVDVTKGNVSTVKMVRGLVSPRVMVQFIHNSPQRDTVDIYVANTNEPVVEEFVFREATQFVPVPSGNNIGIYLPESGMQPSGSPVMEADLNANSTYQVVANGRNNLEAHLADGRVRSHSGNTIEASVVHGLSSMLAGTQFQLLSSSDASVIGSFANSLSYGGFSSYITFDPAKVIFEATGNQRRFTFDLSNSGGEAITFVASPATDTSGNATFTARAYNSTGVKYEPVSITPIQEDNPDKEVPEKFKLSGNYPNPFNPTTTIKYSMPKAAKVKISVYNMLGRKITTLVNKKMSAGRHQVTFDAGGMTSGVYLYRLQTPEYTATQKMLLVK